MNEICEYAKRYNIIKDTIVLCYIDIELLNNIDVYRASFDLSNSELWTINQIIFLIQQDLCIKLCAICFDDKAPSESNSINGLQRFINCHMDTFNISEPISRFDCVMPDKNKIRVNDEDVIFEYNTLKDAMKLWRNKRLAHLDYITILLPKISIQKLEALLSEAKNALNNICFEKECCCVTPIDDSTLGSIKWGMATQIMNKAAVQNNRSNGIIQNIYAIVKKLRFLLKRLISKDRF